MRLLIAVIGFVSAIFAPWWVPLIAILILSIRWRAWEALALGLFMDFLWLPSDHGLPLFMIAAIVIVWVFEPLRNQFLSS